MIPEHIETRSLYNPDNPEMEYGKLEMWIDMFPIEANSVLPSPVNIAIREPLKYQLRVIIKNTAKVLLDDLNPLTGERASDIYVRGFLCNEQLCTAQKTDVHYRSLNGEGNFNWRFVFDFEYLPAENLIVYNEKRNLFSFTHTEVVKKDPVCMV